MTKQGTLAWWIVVTVAIGVGLDFSGLDVLVLFVILAIIVLMVALIIANRLDGTGDGW